VNLETRSLVGLRTPPSNDIWRRAVTAAAVARPSLVALGLLVVALRTIEILSHSSGFDAHAYWAASMSRPYGGLYETRDAYLYSPAFLQAIWPLRQLPYELFFSAWVLLSGATLLWLVGPIAAGLLLLPGTFSPVYHDLWFGNIMILSAAALVVGMRFTAAWSFMLLTKVTPAIGLLWFAARGEWRKLGIAVGASAAVAAVSFMLAPSLWFDWFSILLANGAKPEVAAIGMSTVVPRLIAAGVLVVIAGRLNAMWVLPIALFLAQPVTWFIGFVLPIAWIGWWQHPGLRPR
jgi:hypothetical protein